MSSRGIKGEVHAGRILEGRAVQDVWIMPERKSARAGPDREHEHVAAPRCGVWTHRFRLWRISWINPVAGHRARNRSAGGAARTSSRWAPSRLAPMTRWRFTEITPDSFHWLGEALQPDGKTWKLEGEFRARRKP